MSEAPGPHLGDAREDIIGAYERYKEELPQKVIDAALHVAAETDTEASEIKLLIAMWNAADAYINWCHEQGFPRPMGRINRRKVSSRDYCSSKVCKARGDVEPAEQCGPVRWRENENQRVAIHRRLAGPLRQDLERVRNAWGDCQASRDRNAIYRYLTAVYGLVAWWSAEGREIDRVRRALRLRRLEISEREDPFAAIIRCTADTAKADKRTRSKWSRVMRYAAAYKPDSEPLDAFHTKEGRHQRLRCSVLSAFATANGNEVREIGGEWMINASSHPFGLRKSNVIELIKKTEFLNKCLSAIPTRELTAASWKAACMPDRDDGASVSLYAQKSGLFACSIRSAPSAPMLLLIPIVFRLPHELPVIEATFQGGLNDVEKRRYIEIPRRI